MVKSTIVTISVIQPAPGPASISISASSSSITAGQSVTFSGTYLNTAGQGIAGATLYIFINGVQQGTVVTGANGAYSAAFTFPTAGTYSVDVSDNTGNV